MMDVTDQYECQDPRAETDVEAAAAAHLVTLREKYPAAEAPGYPGALEDLAFLRALTDGKPHAVDPVSAQDRVDAVAHQIATLVMDYERRLSAENDWGVSWKQRADELGQVARYGIHDAAGANERAARLVASEMHWYAPIFNQKRPTWEEMAQEERAILQQGVAILLGLLRGTGGIPA